MRYGASIDAVQLRGYGQADRERVEVDLGVYETEEEADLAGANWEPPRGARESEVTQNALDEGGYEVVGTYLPPLEEVPKEGRGWLLALGAGAAVLAVLGIGLAIMESQK